MSIEARTKQRFAKVFGSSDWRLFKRAADAYLERAARMKKRDVSYAPESLQLLLRDSQKRLLIGVGVEFLLKAAYLYAGFAINKPEDRKAVSFPFSLADVARGVLKPDDTYTLAQLIDSLGALPSLKGLGKDGDGLRIAKVFRNKEGHVVVSEHKFEPDDYRTIERSLVAVYRRCFAEALHVRFSVAWGERSKWLIESLGPVDGVASV